MDVQKMAPVMVYDDMCGLCSGFAWLVGRAAGGTITMVGHHTGAGRRIRDEILGESALDMFWVIDGRRAYGGRAALYPLLRAVLAGGPRRDPGTAGGCSGGGCSTAGAFLARTAGMLANSRMIDLPAKSK